MKQQSAEFKLAQMSQEAANKLLNLRGLNGDPEELELRVRRGEKALHMIKMAMYEDKGVYSAKDVSCLMDLVCEFMEITSAGMNVLLNEYVRNGLELPNAGASLPARKGA